MSFRQHFIAWSLLAGLSLVVGPAYPQFRPEAQMIKQQLVDYEYRLYGQAYSDQPILQRVNRLEKTVFGASQRGVIDTRMQELAQNMADRKKAEYHAEQGPMLTYLEEKLFMRSYEEEPLEKRLTQLETHVFGKSFQNYPLEMRVKKLTYAIPIVAKEIRLAKDGMVIASTARQSPARTSRTSAPLPESSMMEQNGKAPVPRFFSTGSYFQSIHRQSNGQMLRWQNLPVKVYIKPSTPQSKMISEKAFRTWQRVFSVEQVANPAQANVILDWDSLANPAGPITRPVMKIKENNLVRTVIVVQLSPFREESEEVQLRAALHQLGHAFGLWGHSDEPEDVMYPMTRLEWQDIPQNWSYRSRNQVARPSAEEEYPMIDDEPAPSQRDVNTLLKVYEQPAQDISLYSPY